MMSRLDSRLSKLEPRKRADPIRDENLIDVTKLSTDTLRRIWTETRKIKAETRDARDLKIPLTALSAVTQKQVRAELEDA